MMEKQSRLETDSGRCKDTQTIDETTEQEQRNDAARNSACPCRGKASRKSTWRCGEGAVLDCSIEVQFSVL